MASEKQQRLADAMRNEYDSPPQPWETDEPLGYTLNMLMAGMEPHEASKGVEPTLALQSPFTAPKAPMRQFPSGATRNTDEGKIDPKGFIHPLVTLSFCRYMHEHRKQADGTLRASDNWCKGIPRDAYASSLERHLLDVKLIMAGYASHAATSSLSEALNACLFNVQGLLLEVLLGREPK